MGTRFLLLACICFARLGFGQIDTVLLQPQAALLFPSFPVKSSYTSRFDRRDGFGYAYSANMESGLGIYDVSAPGLIEPVLDVAGATFDGLDVSTLEQRGNSLFVGIGDFQVNSNPASGLAIVDISDPSAPVVKGLWDSTLFSHGISHLLLDGDYAYLSTMRDGIIILDISDENHIVFTSRLPLDLNFPAPSLNAHNARGLQIRNDTLYVCFDRGGLRLIDVQDKAHPVEVYQYVNADLNSQAAAAYNDIVLKGRYAFVSVDYCGLEVLDIGSIPFTAVQWYNPWGCNGTNWSGAPLHTNELLPANHDSLLFVTGGQSELLVFDVSDPLNTIKAGEFVRLNDTLATHGLDVLNNRVLLSFIHTPFHIPPFTPFFADPGGLKILDFEVLRMLNAAGDVPGEANDLKIYPNPSATGAITIASSAEIQSVEVYDVYGKTVGSVAGKGRKLVELNVSAGRSGVYFCRIACGEGRVVRKFVLQK